MSAEKGNISQYEKGNSTNNNIPEEQKPEGFKQEKVGLCDQSQEKISELGRELMKIDKFTKKELAKVFSKGGITALEKLSEARTKNNEGDKKYIMRQFGYNMDDINYALAAKKIVRAAETEKLDLNRYFDIAAKSEAAVKTSTLPEFAKKTSPEEKAMITELQQKGFEVHEEGSGRSSKVTLYREGKLVGEASSKFGIGLGLKNLLSQAPYILDPTLKAREEKAAEEKHKADATKREKELAAQVKIEEKYSNLASLITIEGDRGWIKNLKINPKFEAVLKDAKTKGIKLVDNNSKTNGFNVINQEGKNLGEVRVFMNPNWQNDLVAILEKAPQSKIETIKKPELKESEKKILEKNQKSLEKNKTRVEEIKKGLVNIKNEGHKELISKTLSEPTEANVRKLQELVGITDRGVDGIFGNNTMLFLEKFVGIKKIEETKKEKKGEKSRVTPKVNAEEQRIIDESDKILREMTGGKDEKSKFTSNDDLFTDFDFNKKPKVKVNEEYYKNRGLEVYKKGVELYDQKKYTEAVKAFDEAIRLNPSADAHYNKGLALYNLGKTNNDTISFNTAVKAFDEAIKLNPNNPLYHYYKGATLYAKSDYIRAISSYDEAIKLNPKNANAYYNKGLSLSELGKYNEAGKAFDEAIKLNPDNKDYLRKKLSILDR